MNNYQKKLFKAIADADAVLATLKKLIQEVGTPSYQLPPEKLSKDDLFYVVDSCFNADEGNIEDYEDQRDSFNCHMTAEAANFVAGHFKQYARILQLIAAISASDEAKEAYILCSEKGNQSVMTLIFYDEGWHDRGNVFRGDIAPDLGAILVPLPIANIVTRELNIRYPDGFY